MSEPGIQPFRVFVASPGDVAAERAHVRDAIARVNQDPEVRARAVIYDESWDSTPGRDTMPANRDAQAHIESRTSPEECDLVIGILWQRLGHPLPDVLTTAGGRKCRSGTERELYLALEADRTVWVWHNVASASLDINDPDFEEKSEQAARVKRLVREFHPADRPIEHYVNPYDGADQFQEKIYTSLRRYVLDWLRKQPHVATSAPKTAPPGPPTTLLVRGRDYPEAGPYRGLLAYTREYPKIFAGRQSDIDRLVKRVMEQGGFVPVLGASGSGKSSLVEAGLIPALAASNPAWQATQQISPGGISDDPFVGVATALREWASTAPGGPLAKQLRYAAQSENDQALRDVLPQLERLPTPLLVFIDQFEELFTVCRESHQQPFGWLLAQLAATPKLCVVVTMRNDFFHRIADVPSLLELFGAPAMLLGPPAPEQLREIATMPLAQAGARLDDELLATLLRDAGAGPGVLPLLAFTLDALWEHWSRSRSRSRRTTRSVVWAVRCVGRRIPPSIPWPWSPQRASAPSPGSSQSWCPWTMNVGLRAGARRGLRIRRHLPWPRRW